MFSIIPLPYKIIAIILIVVSLFSGVFAYGYHKGNEKAEETITKYRVQNAEAIAKMQKANSEVKERIITEYVDRVQIVKQKEIVYRERAVSSVPAQSNLSSGWVYLHDISVQSGVPDTALSSSSNPSGIMDNQALAVIVSNYSKCTQNAQQLISLQQWITDLKKEEPHNEP